MRVAIFNGHKAEETWFYRQKVRIPDKGNNPFYLFEADQSTGPHLLLFREIGGTGNDWIHFDTKQVAAALNKGKMTYTLNDIYRPAAHKMESEKYYYYDDDSYFGDYYDEYSQFDEKLGEMNELFRMMYDEGYKKGVKDMIKHERSKDKD